MATLTLSIEPNGVVGKVYFDGVEHKLSPPLRVRKGDHFLVTTSPNATLSSGRGCVFRTSTIVMLPEQAPSSSLSSPAHRPRSVPS